jgi:FAD/FMN-containing dehydrogenase
MTHAAANWQALQDGIGGSVILPGSPDYETARRPAMRRFANIRPQAVVRCRTAADISAASAFARRVGLPTAIRSGGHSVAGHSSTEGLIIDVSPMSSVSVNGQLATVGAGARLGNIYDALQQHGLTIPAGCGPSVGIAGLTLGGGLGILGRKYGLTCDHLLQAEVVLADGRVIEASEHAEEDLFWALRGAGGGNFGVVTSFVFRTVPAPAVTVFHLAWPLAHAPAVIQAWQTWAPTAPDELDATLRLTAASDGARPALADVFGTVLASEAQAAELLDELVARVGAEPALRFRRHMPHREAKRYLDGLEPDEGRARKASPGQVLQQGALFTKSEFFRQLLPADAITALVDNLAKGLAEGHRREVNFLPWGGAYNRISADATAFAHRAELFLVQHLADIKPGASEAEGDAARDWLARSWAIVHPSGTGGVYPNFPDPELQDWPHAYYGQNYGRLLRVKAHYDPGNFFSFRQSLPATAP